MTWNYRIMYYQVQQSEFGHPRGVHEVYYADDGTITTWTEEPVSVGGHDLDDLEWQLRAMLEAFEKTPLDFDTGQPRSDAGELRQP